MQLTDIIAIEGTIELVTGLHIGGSSEELHIGGIDNPVSKHPYTNQPYIAGSSLKGKMRSLLEWRAGVVKDTEGKPVSISVLKKLEGKKKQDALIIAQLFGISGDSSGDAMVQEIGPTRLSFWDCQLSEDWVQERIANQQSYTEAKFENIIDRISGTANHPRQTERVPAGAKFQFKLTVRVLDSDQDTLAMVLAGLKLLELDGIGGSGSRGYGKIRFIGLKRNNQDLQAQFDSTNAFA